VATTLALLLLGMTEQRQRRRQKRIISNPFQSSIAFWSLLVLLGLALLINFGSHYLLPPHGQAQNTGDIQHQRIQKDKTGTNQNVLSHLEPRLPYLPIFPAIEHEGKLIEDTLHHNRPTIAGIAAILYRFLNALHDSNLQLAASSKANVTSIATAYFGLVQEHLLPLERTYRGRSVFEIRTDDSIYVSIAAFREYLLADTLQSLYGNARHPDKLFVGVIVNNCFHPTECEGGVKVVGKDRMGKDKLENTHGVPDENQIATFCQNATFQHYCDSGQVRVLYLHEAEALGPAVARYYSSRLWGGETYYVQIDSHLHFATHWDALYIQDVKLAKNFPKAILSTYPPGFVNFRQNPPFTPGTRLCKCQMRSAEEYLPRIEMEGKCHENQTRPTQMAFCGAGFFFAHASILVDVPMDPFLPWMFMGEEIALSIRAWTHGWNIYAPRKNLIGHQYRPVQFGTPHYWDSVKRLFHKPMMVDRATTQIRQRVKYIMGYPDLRVEQQKRFAGFDVFAELEHYGLGTERSKEDYLKFAEIDLEHKTCGPMTWCSEGLIE